MQTKFLSQNWQGFIKLCQKTKTEKQFIELFDLLLTEAEKEDIAARYAIATNLLSGNDTQRDLAKKLKISIAKITRGSNALKVADPKIKKLLSGEPLITHTK